MQTVTLPLSPDVMVDFFNDKSTIYEIDLDVTLEAMNVRSILMYLSNLGITCYFNKVTPDLLLEYLTMKEFINCDQLTKIHGNVLSYLKYGEFAYEEVRNVISDEDLISLIVDNENIVIEQCVFAESMLLFLATRTAEVPGIKWFIIVMLTAHLHLHLPNLFATHQEEDVNV